jgi:threonine/homoserine/homoserine lactone efflux protein
MRGFSSLRNGQMRLFEFIVASLVVEITPGPNMAYLASLAATRGRRAGLAAVVGVCAGLALYGALAALGLAELVSNSPSLYAILRYAGVGYLLWLAVEAWTDPPEGKPAPLGGPALAWRGFVVNVLNPKAGVFFVAVLPDFVDPARGGVLSQSLTLAAVYVGVATVVHVGIVLAAGALRPWLVAGSSRERLLRRSLAVALAGVALWLLFATAPDAQ